MTAPTEGVRTRVLVVDDDGDTAASLGLLLTHQGYEPRAVADATQVVTQARQFSPHVILMDLAMPTISGFELARLIRTEPGFADVPLLAVSGLTGGKYLDRAMQAGFNCLLVKPVPFAELHQAIMALLQKQIGASDN